MHDNNIHKDSSYDFKQLVQAYPKLAPFVITQEFSSALTIDFSNANAVTALNKALLLHHYQLHNWELPEGFLCPPIPSRVDYIHHIADIIKDEQAPIYGLDIGVGANAIYTLLGVQVYDWFMTGCDIQKESVTAAIKNINFTPNTAKKANIRYQANNANLFKGIIAEGEYYHFSMCNPPFHASEKDAVKSASKKLQKLGNTTSELNFGGQQNELWCNGGEALFLKRMIKQSIDVKEQVGYFTSLVSKKDSLVKIEKQLRKAKANYKIIPMDHGNKKTRIVVWTFTKAL